PPLAFGAFRELAKGFLGPIPLFVRRMSNTVIPQVLEPRKQGLDGRRGKDGISGRPGAKGLDLEAGTGEPSSPWCLSLLSLSPGRDAVPRITLGRQGLIPGEKEPYDCDGLRWITPVVGVFTKLRTGAQAQLLDLGRSIVWQEVWQIGDRLPRVRDPPHGLLYNSAPCLFIPLVLGGFVSGLPGQILSLGRTWTEGKERGIGWASLQTEPPPPTRQTAGPLTFQSERVIGKPLQKGTPPPNLPHSLEDRVFKVTRSPWQHILYWRSPSRQPLCACSLSSGRVASGGLWGIGMYRIPPDRREAGAWGTARGNRIKSTLGGLWLPEDQGSEGKD
ncbi:unnamed protein product, partial [Pleuronectes platessa]